MEIKVSLLSPHPQNSILYDSPSGVEWDAFLSSIKENGILEPLLVNPQNIIISGHRRWQAAVEIGLELVPYLMLNQMSENEELKTIVEANRYRKKKLHELKHEAELLEEVEGKLALERKGTKELTPASEKGRTGEKIAKALGIGSYGNYEKLKKIWMVADSEPSIAEALVKVDRGEKSINAVWKMTQKIIYGSAKEEEFGFDLQVYDKWYFSDGPSPSFGLDHPGRLPGQLIQNVLHYWSEPGDLVIDPFSGGGVTLDVCKAMDRECIAMDLAPIREDIQEWDISKGYPEECQDANLIFCFKPGTLVQGIDLSYRKIEDINKTDTIPTLSGHSEEVFNTLVRQYNGDMVKLDIKNLPIPIDCTSNHKFLSFKKQEISNKRAAMHQRPWIGHSLDDLIPIFREASTLEVGDYLLTPLHSEVIDDTEMVIKVDKSDIHFNEKVLPDFIPINNLFFRWLGYYLSDGSHNDNSITFTFGINEDDLALDVAELNFQLFGLETSICQEHRGKQALTVIVNSYRLIKTLEEFIPIGSSTKSIHTSLMLRSPEDQLELVYSYWKGDGWLNTNQHGYQQIMISTSSEKMAQQLFTILLRNKIKASFTGKISPSVKSGIMWTIDIQDRKVHRALGININNQYKSDAEHFYKDYMLVLITNITKYNYSGAVYNLSMPNEHSYVAGGVIVGNCDPPYSSMLLEKYLALSKDSAAGLSYEDFLLFLNKLIVDSFQILEPGGHCACIIMRQRSKFPVGTPEGMEFIDWPFFVQKAMDFTGFQIVEHVIEQWPTSIYQAYDVINAKNNRKLLGICGSLIVGRKPNV